MRRARGVRAHLYLLALLPFIACRKEMSTETGANPAAAFSATIDGKDWSATTANTETMVLGGLIDITGISSGNMQLSITLEGTDTGVYVMDQSTASSATYGAPDTSSLYWYSTYQGDDTSMAGGKVTVAEIDPVNHTISGSFTFKLYRDFDDTQLQVVNGSFNRLPYTNSLPPASEHDTMQAAIDGASWTARSISAASYTYQLTITGSALDASEAISLVMPNYIVPGVYSLDYMNYTTFGYYNPTFTTSKVSTEGTLEILENDNTLKRMRGNFNFTAEDPQNPGSVLRQIGNGYFSVQYN